MEVNGQVGSGSPEPEEYDAEEYASEGSEAEMEEFRKRYELEMGEYEGVVEEYVFEETEEGYGDPQVDAVQQDENQPEEDESDGEPIDIQEVLPDIMAAIDTLDEDLSLNALENIGAVISQDTVVSALDLLDRGNVIKYVAPWGKVDFEVLGPSAAHFVQMGLPSRIPWYCSCSSFHNNVLLSKTHAMCKHILGTLLAAKLSKTMERPVTADELLEIFQKHYNSH